MRAPQKAGFLETLRAIINVAGAVEARRKPSQADLKILGIDGEFASNRFFRRPAR